MKGWVYIISNKSMPGLIKVGYSGQDPELRAEGLGGTGSPHPYKVEYEILIEQPEKFEGLAHRALSQYHEGREWFRCTVEKGITAVKQVAGDQIINETFKHADRKKSDELQRQNAEKARKEDENRKRDRILHQKEKEIKDKYEKLIESEFPEREPGGWWLLAIFPFIFLAGILSDIIPQNGDLQIIIPIILMLVAVISPHFIIPYLNNRDKQSKKYNSLITARDEELETVKDEWRNATVCSCPDCKKKLYISRSLVEKTKELGSLRLQCTECSHIFECQRRGDVLISINKNNEYKSRVQAPSEQNTTHGGSIGNTENTNVSCPHCRKSIGFSPYFIERKFVARYRRIQCPFCSQEFTCEKKGDVLAAL